MGNEKQSSSVVLPPPPPTLSSKEPAGEKRHRMHKCTGGEKIVKDNVHNGENGEKGQKWR